MAWPSDRTCYCGRQVSRFSVRSNGIRDRFLKTLAGCVRGRLLLPIREANFVEQAHRWGADILVVLVHLYWFIRQDGLL